MAIFEKIDKKISGFGQETAKKTKAMSESIRLSGVIKDEEKRQQDLCRQLGECYYQMCKEQAEGPLKDLCSQLDASKVLVTQCKEQLSLAKGTRKCPNCQSEAPTTSAFCSTCGTSLPPLVKPQEEPVVKEGATCNGCGTALEPDAAFCVSCGAKVVIAESELKTETTAESETTAELEPKPVVEVEPPIEPESKPSTESDAGAIPPAAVKTKVCTECGTTLEDGVVFCVNCGQKAKAASALSGNQMKEKAMKLPADNSKEIPVETSKEAPAANICIQCGNALIPGNLFCVSCGEKIESKPSCMNCGKELKPESLFCTNCGKKVK